jgi:hypothetical protein
MIYGFIYVHQTDEVEVKYYLGHNYAWMEETRNGFVHKMNPTDMMELVRHLNFKYRPTHFITAYRDPNENKVVITGNLTEIP